MTYSKVEREAQRFCLCLWPPTSTPPQYEHLLTECLWSVMNCGYIAHSPWFRVHSWSSAFCGYGQVSVACDYHCITQSSEIAQVLCALWGLKDASVMREWKWSCLHLLGFLTENSRHPKRDTDCETGWPALLPCKALSQTLTLNGKSSLLPAIPCNPKNMHKTQNSLRMQIVGNSTVSMVHNLDLIQKSLKTEAKSQHCEFRRYVIKMKAL